MPAYFVSPPTWTTEDMRAARDRAEGIFKEARQREGPRTFEAVCDRIRPQVEGALELTDDLLRLDGEVLREDPVLFQILRYFCGPPISEEDLWTLVGGTKFKRVPSGLAEETAAVISLVIDPVRFPWVEAGRRPTDEERVRAVMATTVLLASRVVGTNRRGDASVRQEAAVAAVLHEAGYELDVARTPIMLLDGLERGRYSRERKVAGAKCDVPVRLRDGRLLALECKVSNGPKNGWKRVNREVGGKAETWRQRFGTQVVTAVVLGGVFDVACLVAAQTQGVALFWEHDLSALTTFVQASDQRTST
ncbi:MAG TPA: XamI family restriction endonuclease [Frankiaceae bacterium]|nr:XamI family restriction endonuclease [Frankiaceae bacterium]